MIRIPSIVNLVDKALVQASGHQTRSWRAGVLQSLAPTLIKHT